MKKRIFSFSQEDLILLSFLDDVEKGFYIDVGANDPYNGSITRLFYELGWSGINIEPLPDMYNKLCDDRSRDINLNIGISNEEGELELRCAGGMSTFNEKVYIAGDLDKIQVQVRLLTNVVKENFDFENNDIHFCKIDVEGFEKEVLESIDFNLIRPWMFVMESTIPQTNYNIHNEWEDILTNNNYTFALQKGVNRYYIENNHRFLSDRIDNFKNIENKYEIFYVSPFDYTNTYTYKIGLFISYPYMFFRNIFYILKYKFKNK